MLYDLSKLPAETRQQIETSPRWRKLFSAKPARLLALDTNAKTIKGQKVGFLTAILYLTPANASGVNLCPLAAAALCAEPCLTSAGRGAMTGVQMARLRKTLYWLQYREEFLAQLHKEIIAAQTKAARMGFVLLVRLNGTSDIRWEIYGVPQAHPMIQFYDYTKITNRIVPFNYDLTFSYSGVKSFSRFVADAKQKGLRIAAVFRNRAIVDRMLANNETFMGLQVVDGDDNDVRHIDPHGVIVALYAKGKAKHDMSGFVVD